MKVPLIIASSLICLVLGLGVGVLGMTYYGPIKLPSWLGGPPEPSEDAAEEGNGGGAVAMKKGMPGMPGKGPPMGKGGPPGGGKGGGKGPSSKVQLTNLVAKLDVLTGKPLTISLDAAQKKQVAEQLNGLDKLDDLTEEDAKKRLDGILEAVKDHKDALEQMGFRSAGAPPGPPIGMIPNPFMLEPASKEHLQALKGRLDSATP